MLSSLDHGPSRMPPKTAATDVGIHFVIGLEPSPALTDHDKRLLSALRPAGIVVFRPNFTFDTDYDDWLRRFEQLLVDARRYIDRERILICIDHEGGLVHRPPPPITRFSAPRGWAGHAEEVGTIMATELASLGVNVNFAPLFDLDLEESAVIGTRSFGADPAHVADVSRAFIRGMQAHGVLACPKHYPGHGRTTADSHVELPLIEAGIRELRGSDLLPYATALDGVELVMTAHITFPGVDAGHPATVSPRWLTRILREELGFRGVTISDDIRMAAVSDLFMLRETTPQAIAAGCDLVMVCAHWGDTDLALRCAGFLQEALAAGHLPQSVAAASRGRIEGLLNRAPQHRVTRLLGEAFKRHHTFARAHGILKTTPAEFRGY